MRVRKLTAENEKLGLHSRLMNNIREMKLQVNYLFVI